MKYKKRKIILSGLIAVAIIGVFFAISYIQKDREFVNATLDTTSVITKTQSTNPIEETTEINIGLIGDSWVAGEALNPSIESTMKSFDINAEVISYGHPGATSKQILKNLVSETELHTSFPLLLDDEIDYIVVIAGVNDTAGHIGSDFYAHHMTEIVSIINQYNKTPILLEVPSYGIGESISMKHTIKSSVYKLLFDNNKTNVIKDYRTALSDKLEQSSFDYMIIPFDPVITYNQNRELYSNFSHLNEKGNDVLGTWIGNYLMNNIFIN